MNIFDNIARQYGVPKLIPTHNIQYDLPSGTSINTYTNLWNTIKSLGSYSKPLTSSWRINTQQTCTEILNTLLPVINYHGKLDITNIHTGEIQSWGIDPSDLELKASKKKINSPLSNLAIISNYGIPKKLLPYGKTLSK